MLHYSSSGSEAAHCVDLSAIHCLNIPTLIVHHLHEIQHFRYALTERDLSMRTCTCVCMLVFMHNPRGDARIWRVGQQGEFQPHRVTQPYCQRLVLFLTQGSRIITCQLKPVTYGWLYGHTRIREH